MGPGHKAWRSRRCDAPSRPERAVPHGHARPVGQKAANFGIRACGNAIHKLVTIPPLFRAKLGNSLPGLGPRAFDQGRRGNAEPAPLQGSEHYLAAGIWASPATTYSRYSRARRASWSTPSGLSGGGTSGAEMFSQHSGSLRPLLATVASSL